MMVWEEILLLIASQLMIRIYLQEAFGIYRSTNNGINWSIINNGMNYHFRVSDIAVCCGDVYAGIYQGGIYKSTNNGNLWTKVNNGLTNKFIMYITQGGSNIFTGSWGAGVFLSVNNGRNWTPINTGLTDLNIYALAIKNDTIFAGTLNGIFRADWNDFIPLSIAKINDITMEEDTSVAIELTIGAVDRHCITIYHKFR